jgi:hypothetical protein
MGPLIERLKKYEGGQKPNSPDRLYFEAVVVPGRTNTHRLSPRVGHH